MSAKLAVTLLFAALAALLLVAAVIVIRRRRARGANVGKRKGRKGADSGGRATPKQVGMIKAICRDLGANLRQTCKQEMGCWPDQLTKRTASEFIAKLRAMQGGGPAQPRPRAAEGDGEAPAGDLATPKQKGMIKAICRGLQLNPFDYVRQHAGKDIDLLTKREASTVIDGLKQMEGAAAPAHAA